MQSRYHISPQPLLPCLPGAGILSVGSGRLAHRLQTCPYPLCALHCISQEAALHGPTAISQMLDLDFLLQGNKCVSPDLAKCAIMLQVPHPSPVGAQETRWMTKASEVRFFILPWVRRMTTLPTWSRVHYHLPGIFFFCVVQADQRLPRTDPVRFSNSKSPESTKVGLLGIENHISSFLT